MFFVKADEIYDHASGRYKIKEELEILSIDRQENILIGSLIVVEDCFIRKGIFNKT